MKIRLIMTALTLLTMSGTAFSGCDAGKLPDMAKPIASAWIVRSSDTKNSESIYNTCKDDGVYQAHNASLLEVLSSAYEIHPKRVVFAEGTDRNARYNYDVRTDKAHAAQAITLWRSLVEASLPVHAELAAEEREIWVLTKTDEKPAFRRITGPVYNSKYSFRPDKGEFVAESLHFERVFADRLEYLLDEPVDDKTGLSGNWRLELHWKPGDKAALIQALQEQAGLHLEKIRGTVKILHVTPFNPARTR